MNINTWSKKRGLPYYGCLVLVIPLALLWCRIGKNSAACEKEMPAQSLVVALELLEALSDGRTNDCAALLMSSKYLTTLDRNALAKSVLSEYGRTQLSTLLVNDIFWHANLIGNPPVAKDATEEEIAGFVAVLCKQDLIRDMAQEMYHAHPELACLHNAMFTYAEMAVLRHLLPTCDINEYEKRIALHYDQFSQILPKNSAGIEFFIIGTVENPGRYSAKERVTLLQAVEMAGGISLKRVTHVRVCRREGEEVKSIHVRIENWGEHNLENGDVIEVLDPPG